MREQGPKFDDHQGDLLQYGHIIFDDSKMPHTMLYNPFLPWSLDVGGQQKKWKHHNLKTHTQDIPLSLVIN